MKTVIVGGGIGGIYTAYYLVKYGYRPEDITVVAAEWPPYSKHRLSEILSEKSSEDYAFIGIYNALLDKGVNVINTVATRIDVKHREISLMDKQVLRYDSLVIATGGKPFIPPLKGSDLKNTMTFYDINDLRRLSRVRSGARVAVIGAGLVGLSVAAALGRIGVLVRVYELMKHVLPGVIDEPLSSKLKEYLAAKGISIHTGIRVEEIIGARRVRGVRTRERIDPVDMVVFATGVRPNTSIVKDTGISTVRGAIRIERNGMTSLRGIYAAGDCALSHDLITGKEVYRPLGFVASHYARVIARNITGSKQETKGVVPTIYENIWGAHVIRVGLSMREAESLGLSASIRCDKVLGYTSCTVLHDGITIGYEAVGFGEKIRNKAWRAYYEIRGAYPRYESI